MAVHLCYLCLVFCMRLRLFIAALWSPAGKELTSWLSFVMLNYGFVTFPCGILRQMWYLIVLIPDLCQLSYFKLFQYGNRCRLYLFYFKLTMQYANILKQTYKSQHISHCQATNAQASLCKCVDRPELSLLSFTKNGS